MSIKKVFGWFLFFVGLGGIALNLVFLITHGYSTWTLAMNTVVCAVFVLGGWRLTHPKEETVHRIR